MKNATLKKRVMVGLISTAMLAGTAVAVAPGADAATAWASNDSAAIVGAYQKLNEQELAAYMQQRNVTVRNNAMGLLPTELGPGFCIDWLLDNPWNNIPGGYEVRKLTGASGRVGVGYGIDERVQNAAINLTKELMKEYKAGNSAKVVELNGMLQALLGNNLSGLNAVREQFYEGKRNLPKFTQLTGFTIKWTTVKAGSGIPNYILVPVDTDRIASTVKAGEYVTVLVPRNYNLNLNPNQNPTFQRIITIVQPGLNPNPPQPDQKITETVYTTPPAETKTETVTRPATTVTETIKGTPTTQRVTLTQPPRVVTTTSTLPTASKTIYTTAPAKEVVTTVTHPPVTRTVSTTVSGATETQTFVEQLPPSVSTVTEPGTPETVTETITAVPVTQTLPAKTEEKVVTVTPEAYTTVSVPAKTEVVTKTVTPAPVSVTTTVIDKENYYTEKVYESLKEIYEFYYFAGFAREEKSKTIELPGNIKGSWTFEIIKGADIVIVERTEDGKLVITPRPDFEGSGEVEILITDAEGNQYIYKVNVNRTVDVETTTKVKVNNFFYTINPGSANRVRVIPKKGNETFQWSFVDKDGNPIQVKPGAIEVRDDETSVNVTVNDRTLSGNIVIRVNEESGTIRENVITVENVTTNYDVVREILNTSTAFVENRGGGYKIVKGYDLVDIEEKNGNWKITPRDGVSSGEVRIVFTDDKGVEYNYTLNIVEDKNAGPKISEFELRYNKDLAGTKDEDRAYIERRDNWSYQIVSGAEFIQVEEGKGEAGEDAWIIRPKNQNGTAVIHVKDANGTVIGIWTISVINRDISALNPQSQTVTRKVTERAKVTIYRGETGAGVANGVSNFFEIVEGKELISVLPEEDITETVPEVDSNGNKIGTRTVKGTKDDLNLAFKPGALKPGESGTVRVREYQYFYFPELDEDGNTKKDADGQPIQKLEPRQITEYEYTVTANTPRELNYTVSADNELNLSGGTKLIVAETKNQNGEKIEPGDIFAEIPENGQANLKVGFKRDAQGTVIIENRTDEGFVFERYTIKVVPGQEANFQPVKRRMTWDAKAEIVAFNDDRVEVIEGEDIIDVVDGSNNTKIVTGKPGKTGKAVIEVKDARGVWGRYELDIVDPANVGKEYFYKLSTTSEFIASEEKSKYEVVQGEEFASVERRNGEFILRAKKDAVDKRVVVVQKNDKGVELNRYYLDIVKGVERRVIEQRVLVSEEGDVTFPPMKSGKEFVVVAGAEHVTQTKVNEQGVEEFRIAPKKGTAGNVVRIEERDANGDVLRTAIVSIVPADVAVKQADGSYSVKADNVDPVINVDNSISNGPVNITFPQNVTGLAITQGEEKVNVTPTEAGVKIDTKPGVEEADIKYLFLTEEGQSLTEQKLKLTVKVDTNVSGTGAAKGNQKRELSGECIAGIVGLTAPLLLAIPVAILSQVQIPGLEGLQGQINAAIKEANDQIQRGLGIYDQDRAERAAGIQGAFQVANPQMIGLAAGSLGVITAGLLIIDQVMHACGASEYTSSYAVGKGSNNERLMYGSSGQGKKYAEEKAAKPSTSEAKPSEAQAADKN